tara:strand:- start:695 stop:1066 length:372 start_codon:yes stop_codon:yes gene_type:complete
MTLLQRFGYYLGGFSIGLIILAFFLNGKHASCSYGPEARVLKNISTKKLVYKNAAIMTLSENGLDTTSMAQIVSNGRISFSDSQARKKPCGIYAIDGNINAKEVVLTVENCDSIATIMNIAIK